MMETGRVLAVNAEVFGDELAMDHLAGATELTVTDAADFSEDGGTLWLEGTLYTYTSADDETGVIYLATPLTADAFEGDRVSVWDLGANDFAQEVVALVAPEGTDGAADEYADDGIEAVVDTALVAFLPEGIREDGLGESVVLENVNGDVRVVEVLSKAAKPRVDAATYEDEAGVVHDLVPDVIAGAQAAADAALALEKATLAEAKADGKATVYYTGEAPTTAEQGDLWLDSAGTAHFWNGTGWEPVSSEDAAQALQDAADARAIADGKIQTFYGPTAPAAEVSNYGDLWYSETEDNKPYRYDGTAWLPLMAGPDAVSPDVIAGKRVPINSAANLEWGVPNPTTLPSAPTAGSILLWRHSDYTVTGLWDTPIDYHYLVRDDNAWLRLRTTETTPGSWFTSYVTEPVWTDDAGQIVKTGPALSDYTTGTLYTFGMAKVGTKVYILVEGTGYPLKTLVVREYDPVTFTKTAEWTVPNLTLDTSADRPCLGTDGTDLIIGWVDQATGNVRIRRYTPAGVQVGSELVSVLQYPSATSGWRLYGLSYGTFDFDSPRYVMTFYDSDPMEYRTRTMDATGAPIYADDIDGGPTGTMVFYNGFFHFGNGGHLYRLTDKKTPTQFWTAYTWYDSDPAGEGTHETALSPAVEGTIPPRLVASLAVSTYTTAPADTGDPDAPDTTRWYVAARDTGTPPGPEGFHLAELTVQTDPVWGSQYAYLYDLDLTGPTAPLESTFPVGASGAITSDSGGFVIKGDGTGDWPYLRQRVRADADSYYVKVDRLPEIEVPLGVVQMYAGSTAPDGWLICDGSAVDRIEYNELFNVIGTTYGEGNGTHTFNLPDLRDRTVVGASATKARGSTGGSAKANVTLTTGNLPAHSHTINHDHGTATAASAGNHNHTLGKKSADGSAETIRTGSSGVEKTNATNVGSDGAHTHSVDIPPYSGSSGSTGSGTPFEVDTQSPYVAMNYIIKAKRIA